MTIGLPIAGMFDVDGTQPGCGPGTRSTLAYAAAIDIRTTMTQPWSTDVLPDTLRMQPTAQGWIWHSQDCAARDGRCLAGPAATRTVNRSQLPDLVTFESAGTLCPCPAAGPAVHARVLAMVGITALASSQRVIDDSARRGHWESNAAVVGRRLGLLPERHPGMWDHSIAHSTGLLDQAVTMSPEIEPSLTAAVALRDHARARFAATMSDLPSWPVQPSQERNDWVVAPRDCVSEGSITMNSPQFNALVLGAPLHLVLPAGRLSPTSPPAWYAWQVPASVARALDGDHGCVAAGPVAGDSDDDITLRVALSAWSRADEAARTVWSHPQRRRRHASDDLSQSLRALMDATRTALATVGG